MKNKREVFRTEVRIKPHKTTLFGSTTMPQTRPTSQKTTQKSNPNKKIYTYYGAENVAWFQSKYSKIHGYLCLVVCSFGTLTNVVNFVVLTRPNMFSPVNVLLTALAVFDGLTMLLYFCFIFRFHLLYGDEITPERNNLYFAHFTRIFVVSFVLTHTVSIWITVTLAIFRLHPY